MVSSEPAGVNTWRLPAGERVRGPAVRRATIRVQPFLPFLDDARQLQTFLGCEKLRKWQQVAFLERHDEISGCQTRRLRHQRRNKGPQVGR